MLKTIAELLKVFFCIEDPLYIVKINGYYWCYNPEMPKSLLNRTPYLDVASKVCLNKATELKTEAESNGYNVKVIKFTWWMKLIYGI